jgi:hypothetical protein
VSFILQTTEIWEAGGISVINSTALTTACYTSHLSQYGSGFYPEINTIDFQFIYAEASLTDSLTIFLCLIITFTVFLICMIYACIKDGKDLKKLAVPFLLDNEPKDMYMYEILVETGPLYVHATTSNIYFVLTGDDENTGQRCFTDPKFEKFKEDPEKYIHILFCLKTTRHPMLF